MKTIPFYLLPFLLILSVQSHAQRLPKQRIADHSVVGRFNLTSLINPIEPTASIGAEFRIDQNWAASLDAGYIFYSNVEGEYGPSSGILLRPAGRYYFGKNKRFFLEGELHYKYVSVEYTDWIGRNCVNGVPASQEYMTVHLIREQIGGNAKWGYQGSLPRLKQLWFECYIGLGWKYRYPMQTAEANTCYQFIGGWFFDTNPEESGTYPTLPIGFRILYVFGKKNH